MGFSYFYRGINHHDDRDPVDIAVDFIVGHDLGERIDYSRILFFYNHILGNPTIPINLTVTERGDGFFIKVCIDHPNDPVYVFSEEEIQRIIAYVEAYLL